MAFSDPITITINAIANVFNRSQSLTDGTVYRKATNDGILTIKSEYGKNASARTRRYISLNYSKTAPNPLISAQNIVYDMTVGLTVNTPKTGFDTTEQKDIISGFLTMLTASSNANLLKLLGGES